MLGGLDEIDIMYVYNRQYIELSFIRKNLYVRSLIFQQQICFSFVGFC